MRAAIYARMSTDKQSADSPADQIARCRDFAKERGWSVLRGLVIEDAGISGASRHNRPRLLELMDRIEEWDVLLCFDFSRLARDSEDLGWIRNRLRARRRSAFEASTGLDVFNVGAKVMGILNEEYLVKLRADVYRGLRGRVERNLFAGGTPYGYRTEPVPSGRQDHRGNDIPAGYELLIDDQQAEAIRRIFDRYNRGDGFRSIAHDLNADQVPPPRPRSQKGKGAAWSISAIRSMILNPIYRGEYIWGRSEWIKDHETGKRRRYERPESEWVRKFDPAWQIVSEETWNNAQAAMRKRARGYGRSGNGTFGGRAKGQRTHSKQLLSGFLECAECGGGFFAVTRGTDYACGWRRDRGPDICGNEVRVHRTDLEDRILGAIRETVLTPENVLYTVDRALEKVRRQLAEPTELTTDRARLAEIDAELENLVGLVGKLGDLDAYARVIERLRDEKREIENRLHADVTPIEASPQRLRQLVTERVLDLRKTFEGESQGIRAALQELLRGRRLRVSPDAERGFRVEGLFEWLLQARPPTKAARPHWENGRLATVVAGVGFEPTTSGL